MADGFAEPGRRFAGRRVDGTHGQQRDLVVELDESLDDDAFPRDPGPGPRVLPGTVDVVRGADDTLTLPGGTHDGLDHARVARLPDRLNEFRVGGGESVCAGGQTEFLGRQATDALAVHGEPGGACGGDDRREPRFLDRGERVGGQGLDLGDDEVRADLPDECPDGRRIGHVQGVVGVGDLTRGRTVVPVRGVHLDPETLEGDRDLLAQFTRPEQENAGG